MFEYTAFVSRVLDGDTLEVEIDLGFNVNVEGVRLRIRGINAPELDKDGEKAAGQESKKFLALLIEGQIVEVKTYKTKTGRDRKTFERYVADVFVDGKSVADTMVDAGHAVIAKG
jgi:micrococcal nuclease